MWYFLHCPPHTILVGYYDYHSSMYCLPGRYLFDPKVDFALNYSDLCLCLHPCLFLSDHASSMMHLYTREKSKAGRYAAIIWHHFKQFKANPHIAVHRIRSEGGWERTIIFIQDYNFMVVSIWEEPTENTYRTGMLSYRSSNIWF